MLNREQKIEDINVDGKFEQREWKDKIKKIEG